MVRVKQNPGSLACELCGKVFKFSSILNKHRLSHTKPLQCEFCTRRFARKDQLKGHIIVHFGEEGRAAEGGLVQKPLGEKRVLKAGLKIVKGKSSHNAVEQLSGPGDNIDGLNGEVDVAVVDKNKGGASSGGSCKRGRDEEDDQEGIKKINLEEQPILAGQSRHMTRYSEEEEAQILNIVARKAYAKVNGNGLWRAMERDDLLGGRSSRGMKGRFDRVIISNIMTRQNTYGLNDLEISLFCKTRKVENAIEQEEEEEERGDDRAEAIGGNPVLIGSDNNGGNDATTDGLAEGEEKDVVEEVDVSREDKRETREDNGNKHPAFDPTKKLANTGMVALKKRMVVIDRTLTSGESEQLPEGENKFFGNLQNTTENAVEDEVALLPPSEGKEDKKTETGLEEEVDVCMDKGETREDNGNVQVDISNSPYFSKFPKAVVTVQERHVEFFTGSLEGLPEGWKIRTKANPKKEGKTFTHYLTPDQRMLKTPYGVLEWLRLQGKMSHEAVVDLGKDVLGLSEKQIDAWLTLHNYAIQPDNRKKEEVELVTVDDEDEDEVVFLDERNSKQEENITVEEEAEEEEAALLDATREAEAAKKSKEEEKLKEREEAERKRKAETDEKEGTNEDEGLLVEDETDGETSVSLFSKAIKGKEGEGEPEPEVEVTFDTTAFVETPLTEGCKKIRQLEMAIKKVEKSEELLKMKKAAYVRELSMEKEKLRKFW